MLGLSLFIHSSQDCEKKILNTQLKLSHVIKSIVVYLSWSGIFTYKGVVEHSKLWGVVINIQNSHKNSHTSCLFGII
jgi:hypothetical protein